MPAIHHALKIGAPASKVFDGLRRVQSLTQWWTQDVLISGPDQLSFIFGRQGLTMRLLEARPFQRIRWRCVEGPPEWIGTEIDFKITPHPSNEGVMLHVSHTGWERDDHGLPHCSYDWARYLSSLRLLCETGKGRPYPDPLR